MPLEFPLTKTLIDYTLAQKWLKWLAENYLKIQKGREEEIRQISDIFGDPYKLAKFYVEPEQQEVNPADHDEDEPERCSRTPVFARLTRFFRGEFKREDRNGQNQLFVLADSGMGKTSLLVMLKLSHITRFWPEDMCFSLHKLGENTINEIRSIYDPSRTVLLLDSLDEDPEAFGRVEERLKQLLRETAKFRRVVITCRTQFFPHDAPRPIEQPFKVVIGGFSCPVLYLSPFSDEQVEAYLCKLYPNDWRQYFKRWLRLTKEDNLKKMDRARQSIRPMHSLRCRPMLLAYIEDIVDSNLVEWSEYNVYKALIDQWLWREERKAGSPEKDILERACVLVAVHMSQRRKRELSDVELDMLKMTDQALESIQTISIGGRSLLNKNSAGLWRFAHYSIQEFLVVVACFDTRVGNVAPVFKDIHITDQMVKFAISFMKTYPVRESEKIKWLSISSTSHELLLAELRLQNADLTNSNLSGIDLTSIDLTGANLTGAKLVEVNFSGASLRHAILFGANLSNAKLIRADVAEADLTGARFAGADLFAADLTGAKLVNSDLTGANMAMANLSNANLTDAELFRANITGANLRGAILINTDLTGADLTEADLRGTNLTNADLNGAKLDNAKYDSKTISKMLKLKDYGAIFTK